MKKLYATLLFIISLVAPAAAQGPALKPSIGLFSIPAAGDSICDVQVYNGDYDTTGYSQGDTIPDFTLYNTNGNAVNIASELQNGLPVMLVAGSYTCPVFRNKVADLNAMHTMYNGQLKIFIIYTIEAHPVVDPSPYSGNVWVTSQNQSEGILYRQPATYGDRKEMVDTMLARMSILPGVLLDGPCNNWWNNFGPAPNNAYLIDTNGVIVRKHGWFHRLPDNMYCSIDSLLGSTSGNCDSISYDGNFSFSLVADSVVSGLPGEALTVYTNLINNSPTSMVTVEIRRLQVDIPSSWQSALCHNICLAPTIDSTSITIAPATTQSFLFHFYTDPAAPDSGRVSVGFRNKNNPSNRDKQVFYARTSWAAGVAEQRKNDLQLYPNPSTGIVYLGLSTSIEAEILVTDISGRMVKVLARRAWSDGDSISLDELKPGIYFINVIERGAVSRKRIVIEHN